MCARLRFCDRWLAVESDHGPDEENTLVATPIDLIWWALAFLVASIPIGLGIMIIGFCAIVVARESRKAQH